MKTQKLFSAILLPLLAAFTAFCLCGKQTQTIEPEKTVVASFYPVYIAALNVTQNVPGVKLVNMTPESHSSGCLHDYHLTPGALALLEKADALIINGGGMETFIDRVVQNYNLRLIDASADVEFIIECEETPAPASRNHAHAHKGHNHSADCDGSAHKHPAENNDNSVDDSDLFVHHNEKAHCHTNPHVWMSLDKHIRQVGVIAWRLSSWDSTNTRLYNENAQLYIERLRALREHAQRELAAIDNRKIVLAHDGFAYLARDLNLSVVATAENSHGSAPTAAALVNIISAIKKEAPRAIITERGVSSASVQTVIAESGLPVFELDMITDGTGEADSYIDAMQKNISTIIDALK